jgi:hypothetical protein
MQAYLNGSTKHDRMITVRKNVYEFVKEFGYYSSEEIKIKHGYSVLSTYAAMEFLRDNDIIKLDEYDRAFDGRFNRTKYIILDTYDINTNSLSVINCSECSGVVYKKSKSKYGNLCLKCTEIKFMMPKLIPCSSCGVDFEKRKLKTKFGKKVCQPCLDVIKNTDNRTNYRKNCIDCGKVFIYKSAVALDTCKKCSENVNCYCGNIVTKTNSVYLNKRRFCSSLCAENFMNEGTSNFPRSVIDSFDKACAICGYDTVINYHHITEKSNGGDNSVANCIPLCPNHHAEYHRGFLTKEFIIDVRNNIKSK